MKHLIYFLAIITFLTACQPAATTPIPTPTTTVEVQAISTSTIVPTPTPTTVEINGNSYTQKIGYDYEAFDTTGKLAYVKDIQGNWIKASYEKPMMMDSSTALTGRLGSDFILNNESNGITGVDGLKIDITKGRATFNFDGKGEETFSTADIHVISKDINGQPMKPTLLLAGYAWNPETKKWDIYNPGFPMDVPKDELGWFNQADIANGNWLRWYQRATANVDWKALFANALHLNSWVLSESSMQDSSGTTHMDWLKWVNNELEIQRKNPRWPGIHKNQIPAVGGQAYSYMVDSGCVIVSYDALNGDGTTTTLPLIMDDALWTQHRNDANFTRVALAANVEWNSTMAKEITSYNTNYTDSWAFAPEAKSYPDEAIVDDQNALSIIKNSTGLSIRQSSVNGNTIGESASLVPWGGIVIIVPH